MTEYCVYDVFTNEAFGGNPLAVITDATALAEDQLLKIAREFNFSETTFVLPPEDSVHDARVRIFTPTRELAFAGHPTVGTALALRDIGKAGTSMVLELGVGPIPVTIDGRRAEFATQVPLTTGDAPGVDALARCLSLAATAIRFDRHAPVEASLGTEFVLVELSDPAALDAASPDLDGYRRACSDADRLAIFAYCRDGDRIDARMFAPLGGILEDPATGSASAALAAYLGELDGDSQSFEISQGVKMGRPSRIQAAVTVENGKTVETRIAGEAVKIMEGRLVI